MKQAEHKFGIHEEYVVRRRLKLAERLRGPSAELLAALDATPGVTGAELDRARRRLSIAYDASAQCLDGVVEVLQAHGVATAKDWWSRLRVGWYRETDANIHENVGREPWSCHKNVAG
jgi:hypothetical protein